MFRIVIGALLGAAIAMFPAPASAQKGSGRRPNVVLIITDDYQNGGGDNEYALSRAGKYPQSN